MAPGYGCLFSWQFFMSARALTMEEMENVNGGLVLEDHGVGSTDHLSMTQ